MNILLIGCGTIGHALLESWLVGLMSPMAHDIVVVQPSLGHQQTYLGDARVRFVNCIRAVPEDFNETMVVLAIKPQQLRAVAPDLNKRHPAAVVVSTLAGLPVEQLQQAMPKQPPIIRIMPNIAIKTRKSVHLAFIPPAVSTHALALFDEGFAPSGTVFAVSHETQIDQLTPLLGSGPAYFFLMADGLWNEIKKIGIQPEQAKNMLDLLLIGSASLVEQASSYMGLIESVASKKGVTEAMLQAIQSPMKELIETALKAAEKRMDALKQAQ